MAVSKKEEKNTTQQGTKDGEKRHTIIAEITLIDKLKVIAKHDWKSDKDTFKEALTEYVAKWEKKNGAITAAMIDKIK